MTVLVMGLSHHTAPLDLIERAALDADGTRELSRAVCAGDHVRESVVLSTCNRLEVYAAVGAFHGGVADVGEALAARTGVPLHDLTEHLYVHYADRAVRHLFEVACGLDSMAVGESQILGQVRAALRRGQEDGTVGRTLDPLLQHSLRVGKRAHSETGLDRAGHSLVEAGLEGVEDVAAPLASARALVVGAGAMSALAATTLQRLGAASVAIANRTAARAERLAEAVGGTWLTLDDTDALTVALSEADVVLSCTGAVGHVLTETTVRAAREQRGEAPQLVVDLGLPRDVEPSVADLPGVTLVSLRELGERLAGTGTGAEIEAARDIVAGEVDAYLAEQRAAEVAPTVVALRSYARDVVDAEMDRLRQRLGAEMDARTDAEVAQAVHRVVDKLLHTPTVQVKRLAASEPGGTSYAAALRELFGLDITDVATVSDVLRSVPPASVSTTGAAAPDGDA
ncbi:MAG: glutamyl-tRNA reductase [Actinomycetes bacterium]